MSDVSSGFLMFIAGIAVAGLAGAAMTGVVASMASELRDRGDGLAAAIGTDLSIVNDPQNVPYDDVADELTLYVKNTGSVTLASAETMVLVNGQYASFTTTLLDGATTWSPGVVAELVVGVALAVGDHSVRVLHTPNVGDQLQFRVDP